MCYGEVLPDMSSNEWQHHSFIGFMPVGRTDNGNYHLQGQTLGDG